VFQHVNFFTAFVAGLISFISPCVLPLVPSYLSFLTGTSLEDLKAESSSQAKARVFAHALCFVGGFTVVFVAIGLSASAIGDVFANNKRIVEIFGGIVIVVLGLQMMGVLRIPALMMDKRLRVDARKPSLWVSFLVGLGFAAGWSPCIGPILSGIILLAASTRTIAEATFLLFVYSMGLAIPFLITAAAITQSLGALNRIKRYLPVIESVSGAVLVATGIVVATDQFTRITGFFYQYVKPPAL
jgi:cytochrome c-type biogenesis protein